MKSRTQKQTQEIGLGDSLYGVIDTECLKGYEIKKFINQGASGSVYEACLQDDCKYAVKFLLKHEENTPKEL